MAELKSIGHRGRNVSREGTKSQQLIATYQKG